MALALAGLFVLYAVLTSRWTDLRWDLAFAAFMFVVMLVIYVLGWMGGGDVKLLAVAFLWTGLSGALPFAFLLALFSFVHGLAASTRMGRKPGHRQRTPTYSLRAASRRRRIDLHVRAKGIESRLAGHPIVVPATGSLRTVSVRLLHLKPRDLMI